MLLQTQARAPRPPLASSDLEVNQQRSLSCSTMTKRVGAVVLVLAGVVIGCATAATVKSSWAGPNPGQWTCYRGWKFPVIEEDDDATRGMNLVAPAAAVGSVLAFSGKERPDYVCVRN